jgi:hypothetical protein
MGAKDAKTVYAVSTLVRRIIQPEICRFGPGGVEPVASHQIRAANG